MWHRVLPGTMRCHRDPHVPRAEVPSYLTQEEWEPLSSGIARASAWPWYAGIYPAEGEVVKVGADGKRLLLPRSQS